MSARLSSSLVTRALCVGTLIAAAVTGCSTKTIVNQSSSGGGTAPDDGTGRRETVPCKTGATTLPIEAFDINPDEATGTTCDTGNLLDDDGKFAALDWPGTGTHKIAGHEVTGCVAAEFGDGITVSSLSMKMRPVGSGCGHACTPGDEGCGSGWKVAIFAGPTLTKLDFLQQLSLTTKDFFEYRVVVYERFKAHFVAICREPTPATGDDVAIDAVSGFCY